MTIEAEIANARDDALWARITQEVNAWRGACLQCFASVEVAVTETLLHLSAQPGRGQAVKLRHLVGQRLDDLAALVNEGGPFSVEGKGVASLLAEFRHQEGLRTMLAHGQAKLTVERTSRWAAIFRVIAIRARQADRSTLVIEENEAAERLQQLRKVSQKLCSALGNLRRAVAV